MNALPEAPAATDPFRLLRYRDGQYAAEFLATALLHLDLFTWIQGRGSANTASIRQEFGLAERPTDVLLTLLRAQELIRTHEDGRHELTTTAREYLVATSPWFLGPYYAPLRESPMVKNLLGVLRTGLPANWHAQKDRGNWHEAMRDEAFARDFTAVMNCRGLALGQALAEAVRPLLAGRVRVLDVGGGSGVYSAAMVRAVPGLSATVLEQAPVDAIARRSIETWGLAGRVNVIGADMLSDPWPEDCDVHLISNVLHDWDVPEVAAILTRSARSLRPGGLLIIHDAFLNDAKSGPLPVAEYSVLLMHGTSGRCYSAREYGAVLEGLGMNPGSYQPTVADRGFMTAMKT
ncbi:MAG: methyltransferase domain-containing protein [Verrucomicrobiales bacterium]|nr:methyltransferase domain-containing protein [Verrucomicrobiales bacterium]